MTETYSNKENLAANRLAQFRRRNWSEREMTEWYDLDFRDEGTSRLLLQARLFAGTYERPGELGNNPYDHWHWEVFLQRRDLVPITQAAAELAMTVNQLRELIGVLPSADLDRPFPEPWEAASHSVVRKNFLRDFHKTFPNLRRMTFGNYPSFIHRLHNEIQSVLGITISTTQDRTELARPGVTAAAPGYSIDFITGYPVGLGNEVYIDTGKPFELAFDSCSLLTYAHFEDNLRELVVGNHRIETSADLMDRLKQIPLSS